MREQSWDETDQVSLCEALDRVLNKGAVIVGDLTISVANIDLVYLGLQVILTSIETGKKLGEIEHPAFSGGESLREVE